jgi:hypothetical protein
MMKFKIIIILGYLKIINVTNNKIFYEQVCGCKSVFLFHCGISKNNVMNEKGKWRIISSFFSLNNYEALLIYYELLKIA